MERRSFIRLAGLTTFGLIAGGNLVASALKMSNHQLMEINPPNIHVRHGFFNLQVPNEKGLLIQRDIFNQNGLEAISEDRIASIKISDKNIAHYGIINKEGFNSKSKASLFPPVPLQTQGCLTINFYSWPMLRSNTNPRPKAIIVCYP